MIDEIVRMLRDGVPAMWVADTFDAPLSRVERAMREHGIAVDPEWRSIQAQIRQRDLLAGLHAEFAPKRRR